MKRLLVLSIVASMFTESFLRTSIIGLSMMNVKPKGKQRGGRRSEWKQNMRVSNQRQKGLRSPIGRGK
jgi:hypothetical protein